MTKMLLIIWRHFLVCVAETAAFSSSSGEPQAKTHRDKDYMSKFIVNPHKVKDKKKSKQQHLNPLTQLSQSANIQTMKDFYLIHFYLIRNSLVTKKNKKHGSFNSTLNTTLIMG